MKKIIGIISGFTMLFLFAATAKAVTLDLVIGNDATERSIVDTWRNFTIVDTNNPASEGGYISEIEYFAKNTNPFQFVFVNASKEVTWVSDVIIPVVGPQTYPLSTPEQVEKDTNIGMYFSLTGTIPFQRPGDPAYYENYNAGVPTEGETLDYVGNNGRVYSLVARGWKDADKDGVPDANEKLVCLNTENDILDGSLGTNRWIYKNGDWYTKLPKELDETSDVNVPYETYGCSCNQILGQLEEKTGFDFTGHYKFGCSKSILEDWNKGEYFMGSVTIPAGGLVDLGIHTASTPFLTKSGVDYIIYTSGTYTYGIDWGIDPDGVNYGIADAEFSNRPSWTFGPGWILGEDVFPGAGYPAYALDLTVDGNNIDWGTYTNTHKYNTELAGTNSPFVFDIWDSGYGDNSGFLTADIYAKPW